MQFDQTELVTSDPHENDQMINQPVYENTKTDPVSEPECQDEAQLLINTSDNQEVDSKSKQVPQTASESVTNQPMYLPDSIREMKRHKIDKGHIDGL